MPILMNCMNIIISITKKYFNFHGPRRRVHKKFYFESSYPLNVTVQKQNSSRFLGEVIKARRKKQLTIAQNALNHKGNPRDLKVG